MKLGLLTEISGDFYFGDGCAVGRDEIFVLGQGTQEDIHNPVSSLLHWTHEGGWRLMELSTAARKVCVLDNLIYVLGQEGNIIRISDSVEEEFVDSTEDGPWAYGHLRDMQVISGCLYATGMGRQVYRRNKRWRHIDSSVLKNKAVLDVCGFSSISGANKNDIYAAGLNGEIWHFDGSCWSQIDSPTNVELHCLLVASPDIVYACGQLGTLLAGSLDSWRVIDHAGTSEDLFGLEWFNDSLFVTSSSGIYRLIEEELVPVDTELGEGSGYRHLDVVADRLWSFGSRSINYFDGETWGDITPPRA
jgi:hypothetical protein